MVVRINNCTGAPGLFGPIPPNCDYLSAENPTPLSLQELKSGLHALTRSAAMTSVAAARRLPSSFKNPTALRPAPNTPKPPPMAPLNPWAAALLAGVAAYELYRSWDDAHIPIIDAPPRTTPIDQWLAELQELSTLMQRMAELQVMMRVYEMFGFTSLAFDLRQEIEGLQIQMATAANTYPIMGNRLETRASGSEASPAETVTQLITNLLDGKNERESAQELRRIGLPHAARAIPVLIGLLNMEMDWIALMRDIISALGQLRAKEAIPTLERILHETYESRDKFGGNGDWQQLQDILLQALSEIDPNYHPEPRTGTMPRTEPLGWHHGIADHVLEYEIDEIENAWQRSGRSLGVVNDIDIDRMLNLLRYGDTDVRRRTVALFEHMGDSAHAAIPQLIEMAKKGGFSAIDALGRMRATEARPVFEKLLETYPQDTFNRGMNVHIYAALRNMGRKSDVAPDIVETDNDGYLVKKLGQPSTAKTTLPPVAVIPLEALFGIPKDRVANYVAGIADQDPVITSDWVGRCNADRTFKNKLMQALLKLAQDEVPLATRAYDHVRNFVDLEID